MRSACWFVLLGIAACGDDGPPLTPPDARPPPPWWQPKPGEASNWDIQLHTPPAFDLSVQRAMYELDLFDVVPSDMPIDYGDGMPVTVKAGTLKTAIADLHAKSTKVVCRVGTTTLRLSDPDAMKFPGFEANPPNDPTPVKTGSVIGWKTLDPNVTDERYLDIRPASRAKWSALLDKRIALAKMIGCDAIDPGQATQITVNGSTIKPGWDVTVDEQISWDLDVAAKAHASAVQLSIGIHDPYFVADDTSIVRAYDWILYERLVENGICCDELRPYSAAGKATFELEYLSAITKAGACAEFAKQGVFDGLLKDDKLSSASREDCPQQ
jgi:glycosyl hydrolase family 114